jgi:hypothetical protein
MSARCKRCGGPVDEPARCTNGHRQPSEPYDRLAELLGEHIDYDRLAELVAAKLRGLVVDALRFDPTLVRARLDQRNGNAPESKAPPPRRLPAAPLLPVKGKAV